MDEVKEIVIAVIAGVAVHYAITAIDKLLAKPKDK